MKNKTVIRKLPQEISFAIRILVGKFYSNRISITVKANERNVIEEEPSKF